MKPEEIVSRAEEVADDIQTHGNHLCLEYAGVSAAYRSDEGASAEWIKQFFEGYFMAFDSRKVDATIYSTGDPVLFAAVQRLAPQQPAAGK